jgi:UDP-glucose 4-epimerase
MKILVTGANGYVGAHTVKILHQAGHDVYGLDCKLGNDIMGYVGCLTYSDLTNDQRVATFHLEYDTVVHLAAYISPAESMSFPLKYYHNNVYSTVNLLRHVKCKHFVFASTGSAFDPVSPYSKSKVMCEQIIKDTCKQVGMDYTIFRFFNVAGNDGEFAQTVAPIHIMKLAAMTAVGKRDQFTIFGDDYDTRDGTCVRDYVHPSDIGRAISCCLDDPANTDYECLAVRRPDVEFDGLVKSTYDQRGYTNKEVIEIMKKTIGHDFKTVYGPRREGDAPVFVVDKVSKYFKPQNTIEDMCRQEYEYESKH